MKLFKILTGVFTFAPFLLVFFSSTESLTQGAFSKSFGCLASLFLLGVTENLLLFVDKNQEGTRKVILFLAFGILGLVSAHAFA